MVQIIAKIYELKYIDFSDKFIVFIRLPINAVTNLPFEANCQNNSLLVKLNTWYVSVAYSNLYSPPKNISVIIV